jgi:hypothetical protein
MIKITPVEHLGLLVIGSYAILYVMAYTTASIIFRMSVKKEDRL